MNKIIKLSDGIAARNERLMQTVNERASFYRENPHRFIADYLNLKLKLFQQIMIVMLFSSNALMFLAARGLSKTFTVSVFSAAYCILYPNVTINIASKTLKQANGVLQKIEQELMPNSPNLRLEIEKIVTIGSDPYCKFKNGSKIVLTAATETGRGGGGGRCNILICDEFRLMDKGVIDRILKPRMRTERHAGYLNTEKYKDYGTERNKEIYMSSVWLKSHWAFKEAQSFVVDLFNTDKHSFVCGLPYQLAIKENLLNPKQVEDDMSKSTFDDISFMMESECLFYGEAENSFFKYAELENSRKIAQAIYPADIYKDIPNKVISYPEKKDGEIRIVCVDVAVMNSKKNKNDATSVFVLQLMPTDNAQYIRNNVYGECYEGGHSRSQAMAVRRLFEQFEADYIVIDTNGVGMAVYDNLVDDMTDEITGEFYPALTCMNDDTMADRYKGVSKNPRRCIYSVKASPRWNTQCALALRDCIRRGKLRLLITDDKFTDNMEQIKTWNDLSPEHQLEVKMPYIQTTLLINELINLEYVSNGNEIKMKETGSNRKDRYSALSYGNLMANELEKQLTRPMINIKNISFSSRAPSCVRR